MWRQIQATSDAFAAILADGSVVTWGNPDNGGDCSAVQDQLRNVQQIQATDFAFVAILADGSVVAWASQNLVVIALLFKMSSSTCSLYIYDMIYFKHIYMYFP